MFVENNLLQTMIETFADGSLETLLVTFDSDIARVAILLIASELPPNCVRGLQVHCMPHLLQVIIVQVLAVQDRNDVPVLFHEKLRERV